MAGGFRNFEHFHMKVKNKIKGQKTNKQQKPEEVLLYIPHSPFPPPHYPPYSHPPAPS